MGFGLMTEKDTKKRSHPCFFTKNIDIRLLCCVPPGRWSVGTIKIVATDPVSGASLRNDVYLTDFSIEYADPV